MTPHHVRTIRVEALRVGDHELEVRGHLVDERPAGTRWYGASRDPKIHDMTLILRVHHPDLVITHVESHMATHPYFICPEAMPPLQQIVGLSVGRGFTRAVNERFGRQQGCAHLTALLHAMGPVVRQGAGAAFQGEAEVPRGEQDRWFVNSCHAWREGGPLAERLRQGDIDGLRALLTPPTQA